MSGGPADRCTPDAVNAYVSHLRATCSSVTVAGYIAVLSMMIQAMAPEADWMWLQKLQAKLHRQAEPIRNKQAKVVDLVDLLELGLGLMPASLAIAISARPKVITSWRRRFRRAIIITT
jgi:hypothetical protein